MSCQRNSTMKPRHAFTLVELLIVMAIIILIAAVTLPSLKGLLADQKVSQAARLVQGYAQAAKARAVATGRPVALIIDRLRYDAGGGATANDSLVANNTCTRLSTGDVFPPYQGDWAGATGELYDLPASSSDPNANDGFADAIRIAAAQAASLFDLSTNPPTSSGMVRAGDLLELGPRRQRFVLNADPVFDMTNSQVILSFTNPPWAAGTGPGNVTNKPMVEPVWSVPRGDPGIGSGPSVAFRVYRTPSKSLAQGISLPRGTCIDLHFSGMGQTGRDFSSDSIHATNTSGAAYPSTNPNYGPIYIVFNPRGTVDTWYSQNRAASVVAPLFQPGAPTGLIHLLVGVTDQVPTSPALDAAGALNATDDLRSNIMDTANTWISINPYSGVVTSSAVQGTSVSSPGFTDPVSDRVAQARSLATNAVTATNN